MSYTEKVSISGTALSFLLYECVNSVNCQEGFLVGDVTSEITNHISDSNSGNARLDTQIVIRTALPLPTVSLFYLPTGKIREDVLSNLLADTSSEVVGWYKYRKNNNIKPTFRDKLLSKGLQKYFEKHHGKKTFVTCILSNKISSAGSSYTFTYRFGKINCFDMYEYIEDVTANLGEKLIGYKKAQWSSPHSIFNKIVKECHIQVNNTNDAILRIQEAVDVRLKQEAKIALKNESAIRELEAEIRQMNAILSDKHSVDLEAACNKILKEKLVSREAEMAETYVQAIKTPSEVDILTATNVLLNNSNNLLDNNDSVQFMNNCYKERSSSPVLSTSFNKPHVLNYAATLKNKSESASTSKINNFNVDLISFDVEEKPTKTAVYVTNNDAKGAGDSSPEH